MDEETRPPGRIVEGAGRLAATSDLTADAVAVGDTDIRQVEPPPSERPVHIDRVRAYLAFATLGLFAATMVGGFLGAFFGGDQTWSHTKELLQTLIPVESILIGGAGAFYYSSKG